MRVCATQMTLTHKTFEKYGLVSLGANTRKRSYRVHIIIALLTALFIAIWYWIKVYDNFHVIVENEAYRSGQVSAHELQGYIGQLGLKSVINLRANTQATWWIRERATCAAADVAHINVRARTLPRRTSTPCLRHWRPRLNPC